MKQETRQKLKDVLEEVTELVEKLDFLDIQLLRKFYHTNKPFPNDTQVWCFPILYQEMKTAHHLKIGPEALRKRLDNFVRLNLLEKVKNSNPVSYLPVRGKESFVRSVIAKFFLLQGLSKFL